MKFKELFLRVRHEKFGEGFILAYSKSGLIGVRFDKPNLNELGALLGDFIKRGYQTRSQSEWFHENRLKLVEGFDYDAFLTRCNRGDSADER